MIITYVFEDTGRNKDPPSLWSLIGAILLLNCCSTTTGVVTTAPTTAAPPATCPCGYYCLGDQIQHPCPAGSYCPLNCSTPVSCSAPSYCPAQSCSPQSCTCGYTCTTSQQSSCPGGQYCPAAAMIGTQCPAGSYCPPGSCNPSICPCGQYCPANRSAPTNCPAAFRCAAGAASPTSCPATKYCPLNTCQPFPCPCGTYCPSNISTPITCPEGSWCNVSAATATVCLNGTCCPLGSCFPRNCSSITLRFSQPGTESETQSTLMSSTATATTASGYVATLSRSTTPALSPTRTSPRSASLIITPSLSWITSTSASLNETRATLVQSVTATWNETTPTITASLACRAVASYNTSVIQSLVVPAASPWQQQQSFEAVTACGAGIDTCGNSTPPVVQRKPSLNEIIKFNLQKSSDIAVVFPVVFVVRLSSPVGRFSALKLDVGTATSSGLKLTATLSSEDSVTMVLVEDNSFVSSVFSTQTLHLTVPVSSFACVGADSSLDPTDSSSSLWTLIISVNLAGQRLVVAQSSLASAGSGASVAAYASLSPSAGAAVARAALLGKLLDCTASAPTRDAGNGVAGSLMFGDAVGQYMRGAIAGNVAVLIGSCAVLVVFGAAVGALSGLKRGVPLSSSCALALDTLHLPSVFAVPLSQLLQPTVSACVSLLIVRGGVSIWDLVMSMFGAVLVLILPVFFALVLLRNPLCSAVHRRAALVKGVQPRNFVVTLWYLAKRLFFVNVRWMPTGADEEKQAKQWKRRYLLLFEDYRVLWYPALDLGTSVGFGMVSGCVGAMGGRTVCVGASIVSLLLYLMLVAVAAVVGVGGSRATNAVLLIVNGLGLCASAALIAYTLKSSTSAANIAAVCLMLSSVIVTVISVPSFSRVVIRLFWFIKRHLWVSRSAILENDSGRAIPTIADEVAMKKCSMEVCTRVPDCRTYTGDSAIEVNEAYITSDVSASMLTMWQRVPEELRHVQKYTQHFSWVDDAVVNSTANELDLLLNNGDHSLNQVEQDVSNSRNNDDDVIEKILNLKKRP